MFSTNVKNSSHKKILDIQILCTYFANSAIIASMSLFAFPAHALVVAADTGNSYPGIGYGAQVLDIVLDTWQNPDPNAKGVSSIVVRIAKDGRPFSCEIRRFSSSQMADASICDAIVQIGKFPAPFGNQNSEIILTFVYDEENRETSDTQSVNTNTGEQNLNTNAQGLDSTTNTKNIEKDLETNTNLTQNPAVNPEAITKPATKPSDSLPSTGSSLITPPTTPKAPNSDAMPQSSTQNIPPNSQNSNPKNSSK